MAAGDDPRFRWAQDLAELVEAQLDGLRLPVHPYARLAALLQSEAIQYVDVTVDDSGGRNESGDIRVWTDRCLAVVRFENVRVYPPGVAPRQREDHSDASVDVKVLPRRNLVHLSLPAETPAGVPVNGGMAWQFELERGNWDWPSRAQLFLTYAGLPGPIELPGHGEPERFERLLPSLLDDLAAN
jgi:hypothetical protein